MLSRLSSNPFKKAFCIFLSLFQNLAFSLEPHFTNPNNKETIQFEKDIAYFFEAKHTKEIKAAYIKGITQYEHSKRLNVDQIKMLVIPDLIQAYKIIQKETSLKFNPEKAANLEFNLIHAQATHASFEKITSIMTALYEEVFNTQNEHVRNAALLRTFLYQYKIQQLINHQKLDQDDMDLLRMIAKQSERELHVAQ